MRRTIFLVAILLLICSGLLYFYKSIVWYNFAVWGWWLFFDCLSHWKGNKTTLDLILQKKYYDFFKLYGLLLLISVIMEVVASIVFSLWSYPKLWEIEPLWLLILVNFWGYLSYPIILISFMETYAFLYTLIRRKWIAVISFLVVGIVIWEVPNIFSQDWIYHIPWVDYNLLGLNVVVIFGWVILLLIPVYVYHYFHLHSRIKI